MYVLAHIGKVPVEEWLPFVVPVLALYLYGRSKDRRRRAAIRQLPALSDGLDQDTVAALLARWQEDGHPLSPAHLPLVYPPGPGERSAGEIAERLNDDLPTVERLLEDLERLGYVELDEHEGFDGPYATLTVKGYDLVDETEATLVELLAERTQHAAPA